ncbi:MAG: SagB/ThcOx family dehydrogenase, partial [Elusimicrobia bacterium]|nr:SagB/ThcOx family dehydrogenase [Elusimicrobiota bacterium]
SVDLHALIRGRRSLRQYRPDPLQLQELSFFLWATQGIESHGPARNLRTVPSAGGRHAFETYLVVNRVEGMAPAIHRYLPLEHALVHHGDKTAWDARLTDQQGFFLQPFVRDSAVTFIWSVIPYRMEWRYAEAAYKVLAIDAGHVGQNLYIAAEALGCGVCAIGAYNQTAVDQVLGFDGDEEFTIYIASLGRKNL